MTLVFSPNQAILSAEAGATYISCFMGRLDDISVDSAEVVAGIVGLPAPGRRASQVLAASIRHPEHVITAASSAARSRRSRARCCARCSTTR